MTETRAEYIVKTPDIEVRQVKRYKCRGCGNVFGSETPDGYLDIGGMIVDIEIVRGKCAVCGDRIKWYSTDARMRRILKNRKKRV